MSESSGRYYAGPQDLDPVWSALPEEVVAQTNWWWVLHPSPVPEQFEDFATTEFITGGMGTHGTGAPLFISDDRWLLRKPPHMGQGDWWTVERRIYFNQWLQHEFMHHLFAAYPELGLEATSHQWFDRDTWPEDFEGVCEADYYAEAIDKRLLLASPSLAAQLRYGSLPEGYLAGLEVQDLVGSYQREPGENDWHMGEISQDGDALRWTNAAGVSWGLTADLDAGVLHTGSDCPYDADFLLVAGRSEETGEWTGELAGFLFNGELYAR